MLTVLIALTTVSGQAGVPASPGIQSASPPPLLEVIQVDGAKNPELIPQWSVWGTVFRIISGGPRQLPSSVFRLVSKEEEALVMKEADAVQKVDAACLARATKAVALLGTQGMAAVDGNLRQISIECRGDAARARSGPVRAQPGGVRRAGGLRRVHQERHHRQSPQEGSGPISRARVSAIRHPFAR
jgi:hypothetical protein